MKPVRQQHTLYAALCDLADAREERNELLRTTFQREAAIDAVAAMHAARVLLAANRLGMSAECLNLSGSIGTMCAHFDIDAPELGDAS